MSSESPSDTAAGRFGAVASGFTDRVEQVSAAAWSNPAPCYGWTARDVVRHLLEWVPSVFDRAGLELRTSISVDEDPAAAWRAFAELVMVALADPTVATREFDVGPPGTMTVEHAVDMLVTGDVFIHTWDLARATGLDERLDPIMAAEMLAGMEPMDAMLRSSGHFAAKVEVPANADPVTRLIAFTGRRP